MIVAISIAFSGADQTSQIVRVAMTIQIQENNVGEVTNVCDHGVDSSSILQWIHSTAAAVVVYHFFSGAPHLRPIPNSIHFFSGKLKVQPDDHTHGLGILILQVAKQEWHPDYSITDDCINRSRSLVCTKTKCQKVLPASHNSTRRWLGLWLSFFSLLGLVRAMINISTSEGCDKHVSVAF